MSLVVLVYRWARRRLQGPPWDAASMQLVLLGIATLALVMALVL